MSVANFGSPMAIHSLTLFLKNTSNLIRIVFYAPPLYTSLKTAKRLCVQTLVEADIFALAMFTVGFN